MRLTIFHIAGNPIPDGINKLDPTFQARLDAAYAVALANAVEETCWVQ